MGRQRRAPNLSAFFVLFLYRAVVLPGGNQSLPPSVPCPLQSSSPSKQQLNWNSLYSSFARRGRPQACRSGPCAWCRRWACRARLQGPRPVSRALLAPGGCPSSFPAAAASRWGGQAVPSGWPGSAQRTLDSGSLLGFDSVEPARPARPLVGPWRRRRQRWQLPASCWKGSRLRRSKLHSGQSSVSAGARSRDRDLVPGRWRRAFLSHRPQGHVGKSPVDRHLIELGVECDRHLPARHRAGRVLPAPPNRAWPARLGAAQVGPPCNWRRTGWRRAGQSRRDWPRAVGEV